MTPHIQLAILSEQCKNSFASTGINQDLVTLLIWVLGSTMVILGCGIVVRVIQHRLRPPKHLGDIEDTKKIINLLGTCLQKRSRFEITFREKIIHGQGIYCSRLSVAAKELLIPGYVTPRLAWVGRSIEAYFSLTSTTKTPTYDTFTSSVLALTPRNEQGIITMRITLPLSIRRGQRRMHYLLGKICVLFRDTIRKRISLGIQFVMQDNIGNETQKYIT